MLHHTETPDTQAVPEVAQDEVLSPPDQEEQWEDAALLAVKPQKRRKKIIIAVALVLVAAAAIKLLTGGPAAVQPSAYANYTVTPRDITQTLSGTGSLSPADSYTVTTLISGDILSADFEEGDIIDKDTVLYQIDSSKVSTSIAQSQLSLSQSQRNYSDARNSLDDLNIKANESGQVVTMDVEVGDDVSVGQVIATIRNSATMSLEINFGSDDAAGFFLGQSAEVTLDGSFERLNGTITKISAVEERLEGNMLVRKVTIEVPNPGGIAPQQAATAMVGAIACNGAGTFDYKGDSVVTAAVSGTVSAIRVGEGGTVSKGQTLVALSNDSLETQVKNSGDAVQSSQLSLQTQYDQLDDYSIRSPISGTIIEKFYKAGDTLESGKTLCTIFDLSYLTMTLYVDELDISHVALGQKVTITADALPGQTYEGYVTKININGTTANGTTSYPVEIRIDETDGLLPGMNVEAEIVAAQRSQTLAIPVSALLRGNKVLVQADTAPDKENAPAAAANGLPPGFAYVDVTTGVSDGSYIEITSGLKQGDVIAYIEDVIPDAMNMIQEAMGGGGGPSQTQSGEGNVRIERSEP